MRIPEPGPFGETFFDARVRAIVDASFVKRSFGGCVESVVTVRTHLPRARFRSATPVAAARSAPVGPARLGVTRRGASGRMSIRQRVGARREGSARLARVAR